MATLFVTAGTDTIGLNDTSSTAFALIATASSTVTVSIEDIGPRLATQARANDLITVSDQVGATIVRIDLEDTISFAEIVEIAQVITIEDVLGNVNDNVLTFIVDRLLPAIVKVQRTE